MSDFQNPLPDPKAVGWRDRVFGWRAVAATTLASVILGSAGGMALAAAADGDGSQRGGFPGGGQLPGGQAPAGLPGHGSQVPPGLPQGQTPPGGVAQLPATLPRAAGEEA